MDTSFETLKQRYVELPESVRAIISSPETAQTTLDIGREQGLRVDELDALAKQTGFVLLGVTPPERFVEKLRDALPMSRDKADAIASAINERIFAPVRDAILSMNRPTEQVNAPQPAAPDPVATRMTGAFRMEPDTVVIKPSQPKPSVTAPVRDGRYADADPYREPIQ